MGLFRVLGFPATDQTRVVIGSLDNMASTLLFQTRRVERTVSGRGQGGRTMKKRKACYMVDRHNHHQPWMPHCQVLAGWQKTGWFSRPSIESPWIDIDNNSGFLPLLCAWCPDHGGSTETLTYISGDEWMVQSIDFIQRDGYLGADAIKSITKDLQSINLHCERWLGSSLKDTLRSEHSFRIVRDLLSWCYRGVFTTP